MIIVIAVILSVFIGGYYLLITRPVQNLIGQKVLAVLAERTDTHISAANVSFSLFKNLEITDLYVEDQNNDTLLYAPLVNAQLDSLSINNRYISISSISVEDPSVFIVQGEDSVHNFTFIIDSLRRKTEISDSMKWNVAMGEILLTQGEFDIALLGKDKMEVRRFDLNASITEEEVKLVDLRFDIDSTIYLQKSSALLSIKEDGILLSELSAYTTNSHLILRDVNVSINRGDISQTSLDSLCFNAKSNNSSFGLRDLAYFFPELDSLGGALVVDGEITGGLNQLKGENLYVALDSVFDISFDLDLKNVTSIDSLHCGLMFHDVSIDVIPALKLYNHFNPNGAIDYREYSHIQHVAYEGSIDGSLNSINTKGKVKTGYGTIYTNGTVNLTDSVSLESYLGSISTYNFHIGQMLNNSSLGCVSGKFKVEGNTDTQGELDSYFRGDISNVGLRGYNYRNVVFSGGVGQRSFDGNLTINDPNVQLSFNGEVDLRPTDPKFYYMLDLNRLEMAKTKLVENYDEFLVRCKLDSRITGLELDDLNGYFKIDSIMLATEYGIFSTDSIRMRLKPLDAMPSISLTSDYINGYLLGSYDFSELFGLLNNSLKKHINHLPQLFDVPNDPMLNNFTFTFDVSDLSGIAKVLDYPLESNGYAEFNGKVNGEEDNFVLEAYIPYLMTENQFLDSVVFSLDNTSKSFISDLKVGQFLFSGNHEMNAIHANFIARNDKMYFLSSWDNDGEEEYSGDFAAKAWLRPYGREIETVVEVQPSKFVFSDSLWTLHRHRIYVRPEHFDVDQLMIEKGSSYFMLDGVASKSVKDTLNFQMNQFDIGNVSRFLNVKGFEFDGIMSGGANLYRVLDNPLFEMDLKIDETIVNESNWGNLAVRSQWDAQLQRLNLDLNSRYESDTIDLFLIDGAYYPGNDSLNVVALLDSFEIDFLAAILKNTLSDLTGKASGTLNAVGSIKHPNLYGGLKVDSGSFRIDYLSSNFFVDDTIYFDKNRFVFDQTKVKDQEGNLAIVNGDVSHINYRNMLVDLLIESDRFLALNTNAAENEYFYGDIYFGGAITIITGAKSTRIGSNARTVRGSVLTVPLSPISTASKNNFISYANNEISLEKVVEKPTFKKKEKKKKTVLPLEIDMDFNVTSDAMLRLEFNAATRDAIEVEGQGDINLQFQQGRPFQMFGDYVISKGDYHFSLQQLINKDFEINAGSLLRWSGKPGDAVMDIEAQYETNASLYNLMPDAVGASNKNRRSPVNVKLSLTEKLSKPNIEFDIELPNTDRETQQSVSSIISTEAEMSRQVLSLLITNSFYTPEYYSGSGASITSTQITNMAAATVSEFLSNQLSNWMSQISDRVDFGVRYMPEQEIVGEGLTPEEVGVMISTQFFDDRLTVNGNVGYQDYTDATKPPNVNSNFIGEFDVELKLTESIRLKAYSHQNDDILYENTSMKHGAGVAYEKRFSTFKDWFSNGKKKRRAEAILPKKEDDIVDEVDDDPSDII